ncbi:acyltransferase family protein [Sphingobium sp. HWE2-09]|uniref:acyltransferase family protein n=1 Tax=Sphingobium sp. HWE2-09 TaxID=3108390 RepID=UPI002DD05C87|nr:acyltransferase [Sphingobium sp. HWE2-09]
MHANFVALDGLRGVAALAVLFFHIPNFTGIMLLPGAYLAVDLFFCISGFVLTYAYLDRLRAGMSMGHFMLRRIIRLYPLYLLSGLLALGYIVTLGSADNFRGNGPVCFLFNLLLIPMPIIWGWHTEMFPVNVFGWTILIELGASLAFARFAHMLLSKLALRRLIVIAASILVASALIYGQLNLGISFAQLPGALSRALFSFCAGMAVAVARRDGAASPALSFATIVLLTIIPMAIPLSGGLQIARDLIMVLLVFPVLVYASLSCPIDRFIHRIATTLGSASYGVYILQVPMVAFVASALTALGWRPSVALGLTFAAGLLVFAAIVDQYIDRPFRAWLLRMMTRWGQRAPGGRGMVAP